jgi:2-keto-4-pentenoate hydratase/2-oxohepta-3-ene-1,7-dioic acid hydratase in catechol pathway
MKILSIENTFSELQNNEPISVACYPDSSILRNNDDFYIPNFSKKIEAQVGLYVTFSKIGKHIETQFISRYYKEYGVAVNFIATDMLENCKQKGISTDIARGFDHSFAMSNFQIKTQEIPLNQAVFKIKINSQEFEIEGKMIIELLEKFIAIATSYFTIKIGDIFFIPFMKLPDSIAITDQFDLFIQENHFLSCRIK